VWSVKTNLTRLLPPHSYINVNDFSSIEHFAEHIIKAR
jgi:hypothetical protein